MAFKKNLEDPQLKNYNLMIADSVFAILIYFLIGKKADGTVFVLSTGLSNILVSKIPNKLVVESLKSKTPLIKFLYHLTFRLSIKIYWLRRNAKQTFGHDHLWFSSYFIKNKIVVFEDGLINYTFTPKNNFKKLIRRKLFNNIEPYGVSEKAEKIYLTGITDIPERIKNKVQIIDINTLWNNLDSRRQIEINDFFDFKFESHFYNSGLIFLLTGPFSEAGWMSETDKIKLYKKILENYKSKVVIIKPHPREKTIYSEIFPHLLVLPSYLPFELITLNKIKVKKIVTISSSSAMSKNKYEVDYFDLNGNYKTKSSVILKDIYGTTHS